MQTPLSQPAAEQSALAVSAVLDGTQKLHLFKSTFTPGLTTPVGDFTANEVNFSGYAPFTMTNAFTVNIDDAGNVIVLAVDTASFLQTAVTDSDVAGGWYLTDGAGTPTLLFGFAALDAPFEFNKIGNQLNAIARLGYPLFGDAVVSTAVGP
jgi:hypothetical protein